MHSIRSRITLVFVGIATLVMAAFGWVNYARQHSALEMQLAADVAALSARLRMNLPGPLWNLESRQVERVLDAEMMSPDIAALVIRHNGAQVAGRVRGADGRPVAASPDIQHAPAAPGVQQVPIAFDDDGQAKPVGVVEVRTSRARVDAALRSALLGLALQTLVLNVVLVGALSLMMHALVFRPLDRISLALERIAGGDSSLQVQLAATGRNELSRIAAAFNGFIGKLRGTFDDVQVAAHHVGHAATEIASGNADLSARTERQATRLQRVATTMETLTNGVRRNAEAAQLAAGLTGSASGAAQRSAEVMRQAMEAMARLTESSRRIGDITAVIDSIAFQTNILALNAAVEAARAGEQGRGFAVVAAEVRTLARRCATAAREIKALIGESVAQVEGGGRLIRETGGAVQALVDAVAQVTEHIGAISQACQRQSGDIAEVEGSIREIDDMTVQNAALIEQTSAASNLLKGEATALSERMHQFN